MQSNIKFLLNIKLLSENAKTPSKGDSGAAGYDLYSAEDYVLQPNERYLFKTDVAMAIPSGYYGQIAPRSGLACKNGIAVFGGVIDESYRAGIGVILKNFGVFPLEVKKHDRIAQIIFIACNNQFELVPVNILSESERNLGGFGSTGK